MKIQVARFSPHQNAKVFAVLTAVSTLIFAIRIRNPRVMTHIGEQR